MKKIVSAFSTIFIVSVFFIGRSVYASPNEEVAQNRNSEELVCRPDFLRPVKFGETNIYVKNLQFCLNKLIFGELETFNGRYDERTKSAVQEFYKVIFDKEVSGDFLDEEGIRSVQAMFRWPKYCPDPGELRVMREKYDLYNLKRQLESLLGWNFSPEEGFFTVDYSYLVPELRSRPLFAESLKRLVASHKRYLHDLFRKEFQCQVVDRTYFIVKFRGGDEGFSWDIYLRTAEAKDVLIERMPMHEEGPFSYVVYPDLLLIGDPHGIETLYVDLQTLKSVRYILLDPKDNLFSDFEVYGSDKKESYRIEPVLGESLYCVEDINVNGKNLNINVSKGCVSSGTFFKEQSPTFVFHHVKFSHDLEKITFSLKARHETLLGEGDANMKYMYINCGRFTADLIGETLSGGFEEMSVKGVEDIK